jgi:hypothetical protein
LKDSEEIRERGGVPGNLKEFSPTAPNKLGQRAVKENMCCIFRDIT